MTERRFSLEEDFMTFNTNDLLYGFMRAISTAKKKEDNSVQYEEYLPIKKYKQEKKLIQNICGVSPKQFKRYFDRLFEAGLVEEGIYTVSKDGRIYEYPCYYFPYNYDGKYKLIEQEMVRYLVNTRNAHSIRIYLYLFNCSTIKDDYIFTIGEIKKALGYAESTKTADSAIKDVLNSFKKEGVIRYTIEQCEIVNDYGRITQTERMVLKFVAKSVNEF